MNYTNNEDNEPLGLISNYGDVSSNSLEDGNDDEGSTTNKKVIDPPYEPLVTIPCWAC